MTFKFQELFHRRSRLLVAVAGSAAILTGCGTVQWHKPADVDVTLAKSAEAHNRRECERNNVDTTAMLACRQQNKASYDQWRAQRDKTAKK